jgi:hypothetical protein
MVSRSVVQVRGGALTVGDSPSSRSVNATYLGDGVQDSHQNRAGAVTYHRKHLFMAVVRLLEAQEGLPQLTGLLDRAGDGAGVYRIGSAARAGLKDLPSFSPNSMS